MSGSKKRGKGEHRATQSSVKKENEKSDREDSLMCSCGTLGFDGGAAWKENPAMDEKEKAPRMEETIKRPKSLENIVTTPTVEDPIEKPSEEDSIKVKIEDSGPDEIISSAENSFDETVEAENVSSLMPPNDEYASMKERLNSTSFSEENYRTPLLSPDLWSNKDSDEIREVLQKIRFDEDADEEAERKVDDWYGAEKSSENHWSQSPDGAILVEEIEHSVVEENANAEYREAVEEPKHPSIVQPESTAYYDRLTADMLMSVIESHRDALNDQKILLARQADAIDRLAAAVEQQTKMISTLNKSNLPILN